MKRLLTVLTAVIGTMAFACWQGEGLYSPFGNRLGIEILGSQKTEDYYSVYLDDNVEREHVYLYLNKYLVPDRIDYREPEGGALKAFNIWSKLYIYDVAQIEDNKITVGETKEEIALATIESGLLNTEQLQIKMSEIVQKHLHGADKDKILISLEEVKSPVLLRAKNIDTELTTKHTGLKLSRNCYANLQLLVERIEGDDQKAVVTEVDFNGCTLSQLGTQLPLTPRATIQNVTVKKTTYNSTVRKYRLSTASQSQVIVVSDNGELTGGTETSETKAPALAQLVVTDESLSVDRYNAPYLSVSKTDLPIFGRYSINPVGVQPQEKLTCQLVLTVDGIKSNLAEDKYIKVKNAPVAQTITISKVTRPMR